MNNSNYNCSCRQGHPLAETGGSLTRQGCEQTCRGRARAEADCCDTTCYRRPWTVGESCQKRPWTVKNRCGEGSVCPSAGRSCREVLTGDTVRTGLCPTVCAVPRDVCPRQTERLCGTCGARARTLEPVECACGESGEDCLQGRSLAMVYAPRNEFQSLYDPREGLCNGTVFCELNKPFHGSGR